MEQHSQVMRCNRKREEVAELLEECPMDVKRLVTPVLKYRVVESLLQSVNDEAKEMGVPFQELLQSTETMRELHLLRRRLDEGGDAEAKRLQEEVDTMTNRARQALAEERRELEKARGRTVIDMQGLKLALTFGEKCKKDGLIEWQRGNLEEAIASWRQGDDTLRRFRAPKSCISENMMILELHSATLRNIAQAAIKLECWGEAIDAADRVIDMNQDDHKAFFRKACALEGLGKLDEAARCLDRIEDIVVGRADRDRIVQECKQRRERLHAQEARDTARQQRMLRRSMEKHIFSSSRDRLSTEPSSAPSTDRGLATIAAQAPLVPVKMQECEPYRVNNTECKKITRDGAWDLLDDLEAAYADPCFKKRVDKLSADVVFNARHFMEHLSGVALDVQKPVLKKWGFEPSASGLLEMQIALDSHTKGLDKDPKLEARARAVEKTVYGSPELNMYERVLLGV